MSEPIVIYLPEIDEIIINRPLDFWVEMRDRADVDKIFKELNCGTEVVLGEI